jgi:hypothetical protein
LGGWVEAKISSLKVFRLPMKMFYDVPSLKLSAQKSFIATGAPGGGLKNEVFPISRELIVLQDFN